MTTRRQMISLEEVAPQARIQIPMAISLGFGILFSALVVLLLIPSLVPILDDLRSFLLRGRRGARQQRERAALWSRVVGINRRPSASLSAWLATPSRALGGRNEAAKVAADNGRPSTELMGQWPWLVVAGHVEGT